MKSWVLACLAATRSWADVIRLRDQAPAALQRMVASGLFLPAFAPLWALLRAYGVARGPLVVEGDAAFGARFACRLPDMIQTYIYLFGTWEPDLTAFIARRLRPGDVFIDVGANSGYFTLLASGLVGNQGRVVAIEASSRMVDVLQQNLALNAPLATNVRTVHAAAGRERGEVNLFRGPLYNLGLTTTIRHGQRPLAPDGTVRSAPLGELLTENEIASARLVKIDVEGGEVAVLEGMVNLLSRLPHGVEILVELSPAWWVDRPGLTAQAVLEPLTRAGFNIYTLENNYWPWRQLWAADVQPPRRVRRALDESVERLDLVLSRVDAEFL